MNLSVEWAAELERHGYSVVHWSRVGDPRADDRLIMQWARANGYVLFTHDLGFGTTLSLTHDRGPSVIQVRTRSVLPEDIGALVMSALRAHERALLDGSIVVVEEHIQRVRVLPLQRE